MGKEGDGLGGCEVATGCEVACKHWVKVCGQGVMWA